MSLFGGCGTLTSLLASPPRSSIASGSSSVYACVRTAAWKSSWTASLYTSLYLSILLLPGHRSVRGGTRLRVLTLVCASERNRAYVTAWLGAQIQRAQLAHRTSRRIVLILPLHSRGAEEATSLATASSQPAVFVLRPGRDKGFAGFSGMIGDIGVAWFDRILVNGFRVEFGTEFLLFFFSFFWSSRLKQRSSILGTFDRIKFILPIGKLLRLEFNREGNR